MVRVDLQESGTGLCFARCFSVYLESFFIGIYCEKEEPVMLAGLKFQASGCISSIEHKVGRSASSLRIKMTS